METGIRSVQERLNNHLEAIGILMETMDVAADRILELEAAVKAAIQAGADADVLIIKHAHTHDKELLKLINTLTKVVERQAVRITLLEDSVSLLVPKES